MFCDVRCEVISCAERSRYKYPAESRFTPYVARDAIRPKHEDTVWIQD